MKQEEMAAGIITSFFAQNQLTGQKVKNSVHLCV